MSALQTILPVAFSTYLTSSLLYHYMMRDVSNPDYPVLPPPSKVSVILPTFNEARYLEKTLSSLDGQTVLMAHPDKFELIIIDSQSTDGTFDIISKYADTILAAEGPKGKLTARHLATEQAKGDIIVSVDADTYYPPSWLNLVLRHFANPSVVGVSTPRLQEYPETFKSVNIAISDLLFRSIRGSNGAYLKRAYYATGGFDLNIDQLNLRDIMLEEEVNFQRRLRQVGEVVYDLRAPVLTSNRRFTGYDALFKKQVQEGLRF